MAKPRDFETLFAGIARARDEPVAQFGEAEGTEGAHGIRLRRWE